MARTDGCCDIPLNVTTVQVDENNAEISWDNVTASTSFLTRIRMLGTSSWDEDMTSSTAFNFSNLDPCAAYEIQIQTICADSSSDLTDILTINTPGCGNCLDINYCEAFGGNTTYDFINQVMFEDFSNTSGDNDGYADFTDVGIPHAQREQPYALSIMPGYTGVSLNEYYNVWIDFDADGEFSPSERVLDLNSNDTAGVSADIVIPSDATLGATRLRVGMRFSRDPLPCDDSGDVNGEYEDYCITIDENSGNSNTNQDGISFEIYPNPAVDQLLFNASDYSIANGQITIYDQGGKLLRSLTVDLSQNDQKVLNINDLPAGMYIVRYLTSDQSFFFTQKVIKL